MNIEWTYDKVISDIKAAKSSLFGGCKMTKLEFIQDIGNEICEGCGPSRDCGLEYDDCVRIHNALASLEIYVTELDLNNHGGIG